ncbi:MAG TPA: hypothetical protein VE309_01990 [Caulobacteraceae bacterium]|nr:hypothetical protein [Caulobacteraceae bacterium]
MAPSFFEVWRTDHEAPASDEARGTPATGPGDERISRIALAALLVPILTAGSAALRTAAWLLHPIHKAQRLAREGQFRAATVLLVFGTVAPLAALIFLTLWISRALHLSPY